MHQVSSEASTKSFGYIKTDAAGSSKKTIEEVFLVLGVKESVEANGTKRGLLI